MLEPFLPSLFLFNLPSDLPSFYATFIPSFLYLSFLRPFIHPYFFPSMLFFLLPLCLDFILISFTLLFFFPPSFTLLFSSFLSSPSKRPHSSSPPCFLHPSCSSLSPILSFSLPSFFPPLSFLPFLPFPFVPFHPCSFPTAIIPFGRSSSFS